MPTIVETEVFTLDELAALGDERVVERALDELANADPYIACDGVSESLTDAVDEACPDCRAEVGVPCTWACSSRWT